MSAKFPQIPQKRSKYLLFFSSPQKSERQTTLDGYMVAVSQMSEGLDPDSGRL